MDLDPTAEQIALQEAVSAVCARHHDADLLGALDAAGYLDVVHDAGPLEGVMVVERAAEALASGPIAARVLAGAIAGVHDLPPAVGLVVGTGPAMCRWAPECDAFLVLDGGRALLAARGDVDVTPVDSSFGATYGWVTVRHGAPVASGDALRRGWQVAIAAEAGATMLAAINKTAQHVSARHQFGRPIGAFQAVQHRLATAYAMAMGTRWLARRGAWYADDEFVTASAAAYGCEAALVTYTNTHQVTGAIGITSEYGLVDWTTRLLGMRQELGGQRAHARRVAAVRRSAPHPWPSPLPLPAG